MASPSKELRKEKKSCCLSREPLGRAWLAGIAVFGATLLLAQSAAAISFGPDDAFTLRGKVYAQYTIATEDTQQYSNGTDLDPAGAIPSRNAGDMVQERNFLNPELEADFRRLWKPLRSSMDDLNARIAVWGFYDGIYDYGPKRWSQVVSQYQQSQLQSVTKGTNVQNALASNELSRDPRDVYGRRIRVNEAYVNLAKGPFFFRIGRQAISWGEADTIGLLDANNPFDTTITPGLFIDLDEARIPLWTIRSTYEMFDVLGPFSSGFLEAYWVPGWLDTTISPLVIQSASPYAVPPPAAFGFRAPCQPNCPGALQQIFQQLPEASTANSRWGAKLQTVLARDYNLSAWFYTTFPIAPVPVLVGVDAHGEVTAALKNKLTNVIGLSGSFYSDAVNSIVRSEVELFNGEPAFLAYKNIGQVVASGFQKMGHYDRVNILRGELGLDRNFFVPLLNPTSSFLAVSSIVFAWNTNESSSKDYRANGIQKPSAIERAQKGGLPAGFYNGKYCDNPNDPSIPEDQRRCDFVNLDAFEAFAQVTLRTDMMHGTLTPQLTTIATVRGALAFVPSVVYRFTDNFLFDMKYVNTHTFGSLNNGYGFGIGLNRDRDQLWFRGTYQLN